MFEQAFQIFTKRTTEIGCGQIVIAMRPLEPYSAQALAQLELGSAYDLLGQHALAVAAYTAAVSSAPPDDSLQVRSRARAMLRAKPVGR